MMLSRLFCQVWDADVRTLVVEEVQEGGAASRSGLVDVDDIVCEVDGINVTGQPLDVVESLMRGKAVSPASIILHKQTIWSVFLSQRRL
jgi:C-terminal processing protease CtpA/Prc